MIYLSFLVGVLISIISYTEALTTTKCYICVYSEKNGVRMPGGTDKCIDPFGERETMDIGVDECRGMCYKSYTERGKDIHIGRGCQINCRDDPDNGFYCCDGDFCNGATYLTSSLTLVAVLTAFFFLKNILS